MIRSFNPCVKLARSAVSYPGQLARLGDAAPEVLTAFGRAELLKGRLLAVLSSVAVPGEAVLAALDLARLLRRGEVPVIGGFQTPLEREFLRFLLRGRLPVVIGLPREISGMRAPRAWRAALGDGRLLIVSGTPGRRRRASAEQAQDRNRLICALATEILVLHATPGGRVHRLARAALDERKPVFCLDTPANSDLMILGARKYPHPAM